MSAHFPLIPIILTCEPGVPEGWLRIAEEAIQTVLRFSGVAGQMPIRNLGAWRHPNHRRRGELIAHHSVDWLIEEGRRESDFPHKLHTTPILRAFMEEPWQDDEGRHHDVFIVRQGIYFGDSDFVFGSGTQGYGCIVSIDQFLKPVWGEDPRECFRTIVMHEFSHTLGLVPVQRTEYVEWNLGQHCTLPCIMRQRGSYRGWDEITHDRLTGLSPFCALCQEHLRKRFRTANAELFRPTGVRD